MVDKLVLSKLRWDDSQPLLKPEEDDVVVVVELFALSLLHDLGGGVEVVGAFDFKNSSSDTLTTFFRVDPLEVWVSG